MNHHSNDLIVDQEGCAMTEKHGWYVVMLRRALGECEYGSVVR